MTWKTAAPPARRRRLVIAGTLLFSLGPAAALAQTTTQVIEYYYTDAIGSVRAVTKQVNGTWQVVARHDYMPFGEEVAPPSPPQDKRLFTAKERDNESGLDYFEARYLRAAVGRFTTVDPLMTIKDNLPDPQRWNRYSYVGNHPLNAIDPDGRDALWVTSGDGTLKTLIIPVHFTAKGATPELVSAIEQRASHLLTDDPTVTVLIVATDKPIGGVLNTMRLAPGTDHQMCGAVGECAESLGGSRGHIDTSQPDPAGAATHDSLHFAGIRDSYVAVYDADGIRIGSRPTPGYDNTYIMTERSGNKLTTEQVEQAKANKTTRPCTSDINGRVHCGR